MPSANVLSFFEKLSEAYSQHANTQRELANIQAKKEIVMLEINRRYDLYYQIFGQIFDERRGAINKSFEIIDKGLLANDKELISMGLQGLSNIVTSSPFANIQQLSSMLEGNKIIEI